MKKDTLRLIITLDCNLSCEFSGYSNVCITGGEPFLEKELFWNIMALIPKDKKIYVYTNGLLVAESDVKVLKSYKNLGCVNVGLHSLSQAMTLLSQCEHPICGLPHNKVRFHIEERSFLAFLSVLPIIHAVKTKLHKLDECDRENEDWILLEGNNAIK